jgi:glucan 1,3-beta-glucosidase
LQLKRHWNTWVTESDIIALADSGIDTLRVPVGDWQFAPYEPYIGCTDGANEGNCVQYMHYRMLVYYY